MTRASKDRKPTFDMPTLAQDYHRACEAMATGRTGDEGWVARTVAYQVAYGAFREAVRHFGLWLHRDEAGRWWVHLVDPNNDLVCFLSPPADKLIDRLRDDADRARRLAEAGESPRMAALLAQTPEQWLDRLARAQEDQDRVRRHSWAEVDNYSRANDALRDRVAELERQLVEARPPARRTPAQASFLDPVSESRP